MRPWWLAFLDKTHITVTTSTLAFLLVTHSAAVVYFCSGAVVCSATVKMVKMAIRQPRPIHRYQRKASYGMPSTHSATISYYATYFPLACIYDNSDAFLPTQSVWRVVAPCVVVIWATLIAISRVWLDHHTQAQVAVGCLYGISFAYLWFTLWTNGLDEYGRFCDEAFHSYIASLLSE